MRRRILYKNAELDRDQMEMDEGGCDVLPKLGTGRNPGSRVLDILEPVQDFVRGPELDAVTIIKAGGDEEVDEFFSNEIRGEGQSLGMFLG